MSCNGAALPYRILFAEDDLGIQTLVAELLRAEGFEITTVDTGDEGAVVLETQHFDLLLTDIRMPGVRDGIGLAKHGRERDPSLPVVVISGYADQLGHRLAELGRDVQFICKPFRIDDLLRTIMMTARMQSRSPVLSAV